MKIFFVTILINLLGLSLQAEWTYEDESKWPGKCSVGTQQSPINIESSAAVVDQHGVHLRGPLTFRGYKDVEVAALNDGHTLRWDKVGKERGPTLSGGPLRGNYTFEQFHFHWLSEHAIDGFKYPLELHLVHVKTGMTFAEASTRLDGIVVIGVLFQVLNDEESDYTLEEIIGDLPHLLLKSEGPRPSTRIDLTRLLSPAPQSYYSYHGSLTTPYCQEVVTWIVMDRPATISDTHYKLFSKVDVGGVSNYRSLQPKNRLVYRSIASCAGMVLPSFLGFLFNLITCNTPNIAIAFHKGVCVVAGLKKKLLGYTVSECAQGNSVNSNPW